MAKRKDKVVRILRSGLDNLLQDMSSHGFRKAVLSGGHAFQVEGQLDEADQIIPAIGRQLNTSGLGLEAAGDLTDRGFVTVDEHMRTNIISMPLGI